MFVRTMRHTLISTCFRKFNGTSFLQAPGHVVLAASANLRFRHETSFRLIRRGRTVEDGGTGSILSATSWRRTLLRRPVGRETSGTGRDPRLPGRQHRGMAKDYREPAAGMIAHVPAAVPSPLNLAQGQPPPSPIARRGGIGLHKYLIWPLSNTTYTVCSPPHPGEWTTMPS